jgi:hypothetical protein
MHPCPQPGCARLCTRRTHLLDHLRRSHNANTTPLPSPVLSTIRCHYCARCHHLASDLCNQRCSAVPRLEAATPRPSSSPCPSPHNVHPHSHPDPTVLRPLSPTLPLPMRSCRSLPGPLRPPRTKKGPFSPEPRCPRICRSPGPRFSTDASCPASIFRRGTGISSWTTCASATAQKRSAYRLLPYQRCACAIARAVTS